VCVRFLFLLFSGSGPDADGVEAAQDSRVEDEVGRFRALDLVKAPSSFPFSFCGDDTAQAGKPLKAASESERPRKP